MAFEYSIIDMSQIKTPQDFMEKFCRGCGTQRCGGVLDEEWREGCRYYKFWRKVMEREKQPNVQTI